jgi:hypothetical protein
MKSAPNTGADIRPPTTEQSAVSSLRKPAGASRSASMPPAKAAGIDYPPSLLVRADEAIRRNHGRIAAS